MGSFIPINEMDSNQSFFYPINRTDREINLLGKDLESKPKKKGIVKSFLKLFRRIQTNSVNNKNIKEGFIALKIGESFENLEDKKDAKTYYRVSMKFLNENQSLKNFSEEQIEKLEFDENMNKKTK